MDIREKVLVLGGNYPHKNVVEQLNDLGYYTIVFDYNDNPPARQYANHFEQISITDKFAVLDGARRLGVNRIVNCCNDYAIPVLSFVSENLGLPHSLSIDDSLNCTDKIRMKKVFADNGIPSPKYSFFSGNNYEMIPKFPVIVKPADSSGSKGIRRVDKKEDFKPALSYAFSQCVYNKEVIVEEFICGNEYQVDCIVREGNIQIVLIRQKTKFNVEGLSTCAGSFISPNLYEKHYSLFLSLAKTIAKAFHIDNNTFFFQLIYNNHSVYVIEIGVRIGGGWSYKMIKDITGCDYLEASLYAQIGINKQVIINPPQLIYNTTFLFAQKGKVEDIHGLELLRRRQIIDSYQVFIPKGFVCDGQITNKNRIAIFMTSAESIKKLKTKIECAINSISIAGEDSEELFCNDLYHDFLNNLNHTE